MEPRTEAGRALAELGPWGIEEEYTNEGLTRDVLAIESEAILSYKAELREATYELSQAHRDLSMSQRFSLFLVELRALLDSPLKPKPEYSHVPADGQWYEVREYVRRQPDGQVHVNDLTVAALKPKP